ncbi:MAG TPA: aromatic ring-hydroxylating dioxygenase subunit alpha [Deltaproteobacteria bacterium]|nr:aromatic ring-hydroxylating dioxygenase subunit alpha [Deltaproteobacteria bacterium]
MTKQLLTPPRVRRAWYILCRSDELGKAPIPRTLFGDPIVLFRDAEGTAGALVDRCPHRSVPLSGGDVVQGTLRCPYHGWRFAPDGACVHIPALIGLSDRAVHAATAYPVRERQGYIWCWADPTSPPQTEPWSFRLSSEPGYTVVQREVRAQATIHAVAENALDVPHTAFLHGGLFRNDADRQPIQCVVQRYADHVECEYVGESRPEGIVGRLLSPSGGVVTHFDRFYLPSIVEVEYRIGDENHILVNAALTPADDFDTVLHAVVAVRTRVPGWLLRPLVMPFALRIFGQDAKILAQQTEIMHRFEEQRFVSTELDLLGPHILKLLQRAERDDLGDLQRPPTRREITMLV